MLCHPTEDGLDSKHQFSRTERFWDVVVGSKFETNNPVDLFAPSRQHDDGDVACGLALPQGPAYLHPVDIGKHEIEDDQVGRLLLDGLERVPPAGCSVCLEAGLGEVVADKTPDVGIIIHDQDASHAGYPGLLQEI